MRLCGNIVFYTNPALSADELMDLFRRAGETTRSHNYRKLDQLIQNSNLLLAAYVRNKLIGVARALSDFCSCCYVADVVVDAAYQGTGVREALVKQVRLEVDPDVDFIVPFHSAEDSGRTLTLS